MSYKPRYEYEECLEENLLRWGNAAEQGYMYVRNNITMGAPRFQTLILMENWLAACETVMAYEKALGIKEGRTFECGSNSPSSEEQS